MIDGLGGAPMRDGGVLIRGDRIERVGPAAGLSAEQVIDLGTATVLPGLSTSTRIYRRGRHQLGIGAAHHHAGPGRHLRRGQRPDDALGRLHVGPRHGPDVALRRHRPALCHRQGIGAGAAAAGGRQLRVGHRRRRRRPAVSIYVDVPIVRNLADGVEQVRQAVRTNLKNGADFVKILATGAVMSKGIPPGAQRYSDAELAVAVEEATRWGRFVAAHAHGTEGIKAAVRAGVRTIDHGSMLDEEGGPDDEGARAPTSRRRSTSGTPSSTTTRR